VVEDYLNLQEQNLGYFKVIVFHGKSGSGKSTYINWLVKNHKDFGGREFYLQVVDELMSAGDFFRFLPLLPKQKTFIVASHVPVFLFKPLEMAGLCRQFNLNHNKAKLVHYLENRKVSFTQQCLDDYFALYGGNYTDMDIILEGHDKNDFDLAYRKFRKFSSIKHDPVFSRTRVPMGGR